MFTLSKEISISWHCPFKPVLCLHFQKKYPSRDTVPLNLFFAFLKWRKYFFRCLSLLFLSAKLTVIGFNTVVHSTEYTESQSPLDCRRWLPPPSPRKRVYPSTPPPGSKGGHTLACEKGMGGADSGIRTKGQTLWYSGVFLPLCFSGKFELLELGIGEYRFTTEVLKVHISVNIDQHLNFYTFIILDTR
jgi:hypothetical protein